MGGCLPLEGETWPSALLDGCPQSDTRLLLGCLRWHSLLLQLGDGRKIRAGRSKGSNGVPLNRPVTSGPEHPSNSEAAVSRRFFIDIAIFPAVFRIEGRPDRIFSKVVRRAERYEAPNRKYLLGAKRPNSSLHGALHCCNPGKVAGDFDGHDWGLCSSGCFAAGPCPASNRQHPRSGS